MIRNCWVGLRETWRVPVHGLSQKGHSHHKRLACHVGELLRWKTLIIVKRLFLKPRAVIRISLHHCAGGDQPGQKLHLSGNDLTGRETAHVLPDQVVYTTTALEMQG